MANETRQRILETARQLFNQRGYKDVSIRNIADELGISVGNLTYHFARKEDLMQEVALWQQQGYRKTPPVRSLGALHLLFARLLRYHAENGHCFCHNTQLARQLPQVYRLQQSIARDTLRTLAASFAALQRAGLMAPEELPGQYERLAAVLQLLIQEEENTPDQRLALMWSLLYPVLTRKGKRAWQADVGTQMK